MSKEEFLEQSDGMLKQLFKEIVSQAYDQGYEDALSMKKEKDGDYKWVDLGLPSGTLWALASTTSPYVEDNPFMPLEDDFKELMHGLFLDVWISSSNNLWPSLYVKGLNAAYFKIIGFNWQGNCEKGRQLFNKQNKEVYIWIKSDLADDFSRKCLRVTIPMLPLEGNPMPTDKPIVEVTNRYSGEASILLLCKKS